MMPTVGLEEALSDKFASPTTGNVSTAGAIAIFVNNYRNFNVSSSLKSNK